MPLRWDDLQLFLAVHEHGSLTGAARALRLGQPTLSRRIAQLEEAVGEPLFERHNLGSKLTRLGQKLLPAAQGMAQWAYDAEQHAYPKARTPQGKVRIAAPAGVAFALLVPLAVRVQQRYPRLQLEVLTGVEVVSLARGEAELALRTQRPSDPDLICLHQVHSPLRIFVSTGYAQKLSAHPKLSELDWISWAAPYQDLRTNTALRQMVANFKPVFTSDDYVVQIAACRAGLGAMVMPQIFAPYAREHGLQELGIALWPDAGSELFLVCHKRHYNLGKVVVAAEVLVELLATLG